MNELERANIPAPVLDVLSQLKASGHHAYLVGGCVRDILRGQEKQLQDFDLATSATPAQVQGVFKKVIPTGIEHGTVTVVTRGHHVEVTTFRTEGDYVDGRRPTSVEFHSDIEADLSRRDFTINAMAWDPSERRLVDPFGGQVDLRAGIVRCVRNAHERFSEDGLRALRAVRFAAVLGFALEPATEAAIGPTIPIFRKVALERVNQEFTKLLLCPRATLGLDLLHRTGLLDAFLPEAGRETFAAVGRAPLDLPTRLAILLLDAAAPRDVVLRLKYPNKVADEVGALVKYQALPDPGASDPELRRWLARVDPTRAEGLLALNDALSRSGVDSLRPRVLATLAAKPPLTTKALALNGKAIMDALGVGPSPVVGEATRYLLELVLDDPGQNTVEALTRAVQAQFPKAPKA